MAVQPATLLPVKDRANARELDENGDGDEQRRKNHEGEAGDEHVHGAFDDHVQAEMRAFAQTDHGKTIEVRCGERQAGHARNIGDQSNLDQLLRDSVENLACFVVAVHRQGDEDVFDVVFLDKPGQVGRRAEDVEVAGEAGGAIFDEPNVLDAHPAYMPQNFRCPTRDASSADNDGERLVIAIAAQVANCVPHEAPE